MGICGCECEIDVGVSIYQWLYECESVSVRQHERVYGNV